MRTLLLVLFSFLSALLAIACASGEDAPAPGASALDDDGASFPVRVPPSATPVSTDDPEADATPTIDPTMGTPPPPLGDDAEDPTIVDAASEDPPFDANPDGACSAPLAPGDLVIDELMIASISGSGDYGEWLEVVSTADCAIDLRGLHGECPRGAKVATFDVTAPTWLPPHGTFVVADSIDPAINHDLPGMVLVWVGLPGDVLRNMGTTVTLSQNDVLVDTVTYPSLSPTVGASIAFPLDCDAAARSDWTQWQTSTASWFPSFAGTPNAPNADVHCP